MGGPKLSGLSLSPDGRYLLFASDRLDPDSSNLTPVSTRKDPAPEVNRLAEVLKRNPPPSRAKTGVRMQLFMRDLVEGRTTPIADESVLGLPSPRCPTWSHDGTRIVFHISPGKDWSQSQDRR